MKLMACAVVLVMAGILQVTFASLFPIRAAVLDFGLLSVVFIALAGGPRAAMFAAPVAALTVGFTSDRSPGLLLMAYLPVLPLAAFADEARFPVSRYVVLLCVVLLSGIWARVMLTLGPLSEGADFGLAVFIRDLVLPGLVLDFLAFTALYAPLRLLGRVHETLTPQRSRYLA